MKKKILFLVGPTAVGKTSVAIELAKKINAEIISCDSMQIYRGMNIGTQKPSLELRGQVRHHMVDILTPDKEFSAADFKKRATKAISAIHKKDKIPLIVGGTGLYMKVLLDGLFPSPPKDEELRKKLYKQHEQHRGAYLYDKLKEIDSQAAMNIHPNDIKKIIRALEIYHTTGKAPSRLKAKTRPLGDKFCIHIFGLIMSRDRLYKRINERVDRMFEDGLVEEARDLSKKRLSLTAAQAIGYQEALEYLKGAISLEEAKELIKKNTRRYAKRQLTWFRADKRVEWVAIKEGEENAKVIDKITQFLGLSV